MSEIDLFRNIVELKEPAPLSVINPIKISYSKGQAFKACQYKFALAHVEKHPSPDRKKPGLMPKTKAPALELGSHGHAIMEHAMNALMKKDFPYSVEDCTQAANDAIVFGLSQEAGSRTPEIMKQIMWFMANRFPFLGWRILAVEKEYMLPLGKDQDSGRDIVYPFTVDLVIELAGQIYIVDYKFAADAYSQDRQDVEPQIPGYIGAMRALGIPVKDGFYVFLRTRKMNNVEDQIVVSPVRPNDIRVKRSFQEHLKTTGDIIMFEKQYQASDGNMLIVRNAGNNCGYCDFKKICAIELRGDDAALMKELDFLPNDYGYEEL